MLQLIFCEKSKIIRAINNNNNFKQQRKAGLSIAKKEKKLYNLPPNFFLYIYP